MIRRPPRSTRTDTLFPYTTLFRSSFSRAVDEDSVARVGTYDEEVQVNPATDSLLPDIAAWLVHLGTVDEMRWPLLAVDLHRNPALIPTWLTFTPGKRIQVTHTLSQLPGVDVDVVAEGWTETRS